MLTPQVISAIKQSFSRSKFRKDIMSKSIVKGKRGKKGGPIVECSLCKAHMPRYKAVLDHIEPCIPIIVPAKRMAFSWLYNRTFCDASNLQVLDKACHSVKTKVETGERVKWRKRKKYLVCRSIEGCKIEVIPITNMKDLESKWEILIAYEKRPDADKEAKRRRKL